jgi:hypothetical protein
MQGIYREDGCKWLVEILSDQTTDAGRTVELRLLRVIRPPRPPVRQVPDPGDEWKAFQAKGYEYLAGWTLQVLP